MPLRQFLCPDGARIDTDQCIAKCRMKDRCLTKSTLIRLAENRPDLGKPSVTELINGPRLTFLKRTRDYATSPEDLAFALLGTMSHSALEMAQHLDGSNEERLHSDLTTGQFDNLEYEDGMWHLTDYKTWGAYKIAKMLEEGDEDLEMQLNMLRILIEEAKLKVGDRTVDKIGRLWVQVIVRDPAWAAKRSGIEFQMRRLSVPIIADNQVKAFFDSQKADLMTALQTNKMPRLCNSRESWSGKRCDKYCPVKEHCVAHGDNLYVATKKKEKKG